MNSIQLLPVGNLEGQILQGLRAGLTTEFQAPCEIMPSGLDPGFAFNPERQQYHSTQLLARMRAFLRPDSWRLLGVTGVDLFIPILTFVFGESQVGDACAVVSCHRLRQEFYGLPPDEALLRDRLLKEAIHELGHTVELPHCPDHRCVMASSHAVEWVDVKGSSFCENCRSLVMAAGGRTPR